MCITDPGHGSPEQHVTRQARGAKQARTLYVVRDGFLIEAESGDNQTFVYAFIFCKDLDWIEGA